MDKKINIRIAIYSRKSRFADKGDSIGNQIEIAKEYIKLHFPKDIYDTDITIYEDEGFSGKSFDRPEFKKFLEDERKKPFNLLVCYRLDRISRNIADFSSLINELNELNTNFISIKEQFDTKTPMGRAMMYIASVFAQLEREVIAERIKDNLLELAKTGTWLGGDPPLGFKSLRYKKVDILNDEEQNAGVLTTKKKNATKLIIDEEEVKLVKLIFNKYLSLKSLSALETYLLNNDIKTRKNVNFSLFSLKWILTNPAYVQNDLNVKKYFEEKGIQVFTENDERNKFNGKFGFLTYHKTSNRTETDPKEWIIAVGLHPAIISSSDWIAVQNLIEENKSKMFRANHLKNSIVSGLIKCKECGSYMRARNTDKVKNGYVTYSYCCQLKEKSKTKKCNSPNVYGNRLDEKIADIIKSIFVPNSEVYKELKKMSIKSLEENSNDDLSILEEAYNKNQNEIDNIVNKLQYLDIDLMEMVNGKLKVLKEKKENLENQISKIKESKSKLIMTNTKSETAKDILKIIDNSFNIFNTFDLKTKKNILALFVKKITGEKNNVEIELLNTQVDEVKKKIFIPTCKQVDNFLPPDLPPEGVRINSHGNWGIYNIICKFCNCISENMEQLLIYQTYF